MQQIRHYLLISILLMSPVALWAQQIMLDSAFVARAQRGVDYAYDMQFEEANAVFNQLEREYPNHPAGPFMKALTRWWSILPDMGDKSLDSQFHRDMQQVAQRCDRLLRTNKNSFDAILFKSMANGFRSRLYANRSDFIPAFRYGKRAVDLVANAAEIAPENNDYYFGWGVYDYFADILPQKYRYLKAAMIFMPSGSRDRGLTELKRTFEKGTFMRAEAAYYLFQIYYVYEPNFGKALYYIQWLRSKYPNNSFYHILEARVYNYWGRRDQAQQSFQEVIRRYQNRQTGYSIEIAEQAYYYLGLIEMLYGDYEDAEDLLRQLVMIDNQRKGNSRFAVLGHLRLGMVYDALGKRDDAIRLYEKVRRMEDVSGSRKRAQGFLKIPYKGR